MSVDEHKKDAPEKIRFSILTISDRCSRGDAEDISGSYILTEVSKTDDVVEHRTVPDEVGPIREAVIELMDGCDCLVTTGGTGVARRDVTIPAIEPLITKQLPGFGELFRSLSYEEVGTAAMMSGAMSGIIGNGAVFCLPGSLPAVRLGMTIVTSESHHLIKHLRD